MLLSIELFSFLLKNFLTICFMLINTIWIKFSITNSTWPQLWCIIFYNANLNLILSVNLLNTFLFSFVIKLLGSFLWSLLWFRTLTIIILISWLIIAFLRIDILIVFVNIGSVHWLNITIVASIIVGLRVGWRLCWVVICFIRSSICSILCSKAFFRIFWIIIFHWRWLSILFPCL